MFMQCDFGWGQTVPSATLEFKTTGDGCPDWTTSGYSDAAARCLAANDDDDAATARRWAAGDDDAASARRGTADDDDAASARRWTADGHGAATARRQYDATSNGRTAGECPR